MFVGVLFGGLFVLVQLYVWDEIRGYVSAGVRFYEVVVGAWLGDDHMGIHIGVPFSSEFVGSL